MERVIRQDLRLQDSGMAVTSRALTLDAVTSTRVDAFSWTWADIAAKLGLNGEERLSRF